MNGPTHWYTRIAERYPTELQSTFINVGSITYKLGSSGSRTLASTGGTTPAATGMLSSDLSGAVSADGGSSSEAEPTETLLVKMKN